MNGATKKTTISLATIGALAVVGWQIWPVVDGVFFTQAEAADVAQVQRRVNYQDRVDIVELHLKHETDPEEIAKLQAEADYYRERIRKLDDAGDDL